MSSQMIKFNIASINRCTEAEGPYKRLCIWFQGCNIHCKGCCNPDYQPLTPKNILSLEEVVRIVKEAQNEFGIEGVTYSGGEPTLQQGLPRLTDEIHKLGLGVISFTGRQYEDIKKLLRGCDTVLDGQFFEDRLETKRRLLGSQNKRIICLTDRYRNYIEDWFNRTDLIAEVNVGTNIIINGDKV